MTGRHIVGLLLLALCGCGSDIPDSTDQAPPPEPGLVAFTNATFWDGTGADALRGATLLVRDGRIESLSRDPAPPAARTVDLGGGYVIPGLINTHGHVSGRWADGGVEDTAERIRAELRLLARYGVTTVNSLGGAPAAAIAVRDAQATPSLVHARLYVAGPVITDRDPAAARASAEANVAMGVDWLKLRVDDNLGRVEKMPWDAVQAVLDVAAANELALATHIFYLADASRALDMGSGMIAHSVRDQPVSDDFIRKLIDTGTCYVPTLTREVSTFVYADRPAFFDDPFFLRHADRDEMARVSDPEFMTAMADSEVAAGYRDGLAVATQNLVTLAAAGAPFAFGTDSGPPGRFPGYFEHLELEMMVDAGLTPEQALLAATGDAAECLRLDGVGTLESGNWADFLVLADDPLAAIAATKTLRQVYVAGNAVR